MEEDLSRAGLSQGRCDGQRREERGELRTSQEDTKLHDKPQNCVQNSHNAGWIGEGKVTSYIPESSHGHSKAWWP